MHLVLKNRTEIGSALNHWTSKRLVKYVLLASATDDITQIKNYLMKSSIYDFAVKFDNFDNDYENPLVEVHIEFYEDVSEICFLSYFANNIYNRIAK